MLLCVITLVLATMPSADQLLTQGDWHDELPTPSVPLLTFIDINHVNISWDFDFSALDPARNVCFVIEYQNNTRYANVSSPICERNRTFYIFPWLLKGQMYCFRVYATDGVMTTIGNWSFSFINGIEAPPGPPRNFKTQVLSDTEIILTWSGVLMQADILVAYEICFNELTSVCVDNNPEIFVVGTTSYVLSGLKSDTTYYFEIRASVGPFYSVWSDWISVTTESSTELLAPSTPEMTFISISSVNLSWSFDFSAVNPARNVCFVIEYQNNTRYANVSSPICEGNHTFYIFPWLLRGQRYRFRVYATDGVTTTVSDWTFMFINGIEAPPGPPQKFRAQVLSDMEVILTWKALDLITPAVYEICYNALSPMCVDRSKIVIGDTYHQFLELKPATTYYFEIRASLGPFYSVWSDWISAITKRSIAEFPPPSTPEMTFISFGSVNLSWSFDFSAVDPARDVCFVIEYQNNTRYANVSSPICKGNHTFYIFPWLLRGQRYRFRVYATDGVTTTVSDWSLIFIDGIDAPPGPPQKFTAQVLSDMEVILTWKALELLTPVVYEICYNALSPMCVDKSKIVIGDTYHQFLGLKPATTYYFEIRASVGPFYSVWSDWINATTERSSDVINPTTTTIATTTHESCATGGPVGTASVPTPTESPGCNNTTNNKDGTTMTSTPTFLSVILAVLLSILQC